MDFLLLIRKLFNTLDCDDKICFFVALRTSVLAQCRAERLSDRKIIQILENGYCTNQPIVCLRSLAKYMIKLRSKTHFCDGKFKIAVLSGFMLSISATLGDLDWGTINYNFIDHHLSLDPWEAPHFIEEMPKLITSRTLWEFIPKTVIDYLAKYYFNGSDSPQESRLLTYCLFNIVNMACDFEAATDPTLVGDFAVRVHQRLFTNFICYINLCGTEQYGHCRHFDTWKYNVNFNKYCTNIEDEYFCFEMFKHTLVQCLSNLVQEETVPLIVAVTDTSKPGYYPAVTVKNTHSREKAFCFNNQNAILESAEALQLQYVNIAVEDVRKIILSVRCITDLYWVKFNIPRPTVDEKQLLKIQSAEERLITFKCNKIFYKTVHLLLRFQNYNPDGSWIKFWKWKLASFYSYCYKQERIPRPNLNFGHAARPDPFFSDEILLGGYYHDFLGAIRAKVEKGNQELSFLLDSFYSSVNMAKKGMPRAPKCLVEQQILDTFKVLTTAPIQYEGERLKVADLKLALTQTTLELFQSEKFTLSDVHSPQFPSTSACYSESVDKGGQAEAIRKLVVVEFMPPDPMIGTCYAELCEKRSVHYGNLGCDEDLYNKILREAGLEPTEPIDAKVFDFREFDDFFANQFDNLFKLAWAEIPAVKLVGLLEALKVRVISKGPAVSYFCLKWFQKFLFRVLRKHKCFKFIGEPISWDEIKDFFRFQKPGETFISGDYKASTDNLRSWVSETIADAMFRQLGENVDILEFKGIDNFLPQLKMLVVRALTGHKILHPVTGELHDQLNGQLMGSIVSFPFLCIANLSFCRLAIEICLGKKIPIGKLPLFINGDDCLLRVPKTCYALWLEITRIGGLESSIGKTYVDEEMATLNSLTFRKTKKPNTFMGEWDDWYIVPALNLGLIYGMKRSSVSNEAVDISQLGSLARDLSKDYTRNFPSFFFLEERERAFKLFFEKNSEALHSTTLSWFAPSWAGGLGIPGSLSDVDRHVVSVIRQNYAKDIIPLTGEAEWLTHYNVIENFDLRNTVAYNGIIANGIRSELEMNYNKVYGRLCSREFFASCFRSESQLDIKKRFEKVVSQTNFRDVRSMMRIVSHNMRIWRKALKEIYSGRYELISDEELLGESKKFFPPILVDSGEGFVGEIEYLFRRYEDLSM